MDVNHVITATAWILTFFGGLLAIYAISLATKILDKQTDVLKKQQETQEMIKEIEEDRTKFEEDRFNKERSDNRILIRLEAFNEFILTINHLFKCITSMQVGLSRDKSNEMFSAYNSLQSKETGGTFNVICDNLEIFTAKINVLFPNKPEKNKILEDIMSITMEARQIYGYILENPVDETNLKTMRDKAQSLALKSFFLQKDIPDYFRQFFVINKTPAKKKIKSKRKATKK